MKSSKQKQSLPFWGRCLGVLAIATGGLLFTLPALAVDNCIQDVWQAHGNNQNLTCTANDVTLSKVTDINISTGGSCTIENGVKVCKCNAGGSVTFDATYQMNLTADTRYDIGFYIETGTDTNNDGALTGTCTATAALAANTLNFKNLDAAPDVCGDITGPLNTAFNPQLVKQSITVPCEEGEVVNGKIDLDFCTTWRQPGSNEVCLGTGNGTTTNDVYPGSPSKCNCGTLAIDIFFETATITTTKTAITTSVPETGGSATYSVSVKNNASVVSVTLDALEDDKYGDITAIHAANVDCGSFATCLAVTATDCTLATIAHGVTYSCTFTGTMPPGDFPGSLTDVVEACGTDSLGHTNLCDDDDAIVPYLDVLQPPTLSKTATNASCQVDFTYSVVVTNGSGQDGLTLNSLSDDKYGSITSAHAAGGGFGQVVSTTCGIATSATPPGAGTLPASIAAGGNYSCSFVGRVTTCDTTIVDIVTGGATDDDGATYSVTGTATVVVDTTPPN